MGELKDGMNAEAARGRATARLEEHFWDLVVIGGGITGAGVAQQAAHRGWKVLLVEQRDFAWGSSSRSSKLVHGGMRYLMEGDIKATLHSVRERQRLLREAPELIEPQSFLFANYTGIRSEHWLFQAGLKIHDLMAGERSHFYANQADTQALAPGLNPPGLRGSLVYQDAKTDDARLVWRVLQQAQDDGATTLNYVVAQELTLNAGRVVEVKLQDVTNGKIYNVQAKTVVNAAGAWGDRLRAGLGAKPMLHPLRGSHLIVPFWRMPVAQGISLMHPQDDQPVFLYPWEGCVLIGTTYLNHRDSLDLEASITPAEVDYLLCAVNHQFPAAKLTASDISACYAGVRPVLNDDSHVVLNESGLITLVGGKLTTFRLMAQDALALAAKYVGKPFRRDDARVFSPSSTLPPHWNTAVCSRLRARYGHRAQELSAHATEANLQTVLGTNTLWLELIIAAQHEAIVHLDDLLLRRTRLGLLLPRGALDHLDHIRTLCQPHLAWNAKKWDNEIARYRAIIAAHYQLPAIRLPT
ncbi:MAG: glycerol-3-phosphate dehydrogenase/oxidase [Rhodoferax sp.]|nr:glycerol-3-phosphate dehydrogenase/oxidase [Rhodoferax sp.]